MLPSTCGKAKNLQSPQARREPWTIGRTTRAKPVSWISECLITGRTCQSVMSFSEPIPCGCIFKQCYFRNGRIRTVFHRKNLFTLDCLKQPHLSHFRKRRPWPPLTPTTVVDCWNKCLTTSFRMLTTFSSKWKLENSWARTAGKRNCPFCRIFPPGNVSGSSQPCQPATAWRVDPHPVRSKRSGLIFGSGACFRPAKGRCTAMPRSWFSRSPRIFRGWSR